MLIIGCGLNYVATMLLLAALQKGRPGLWDRALIGVVVGGLFVCGGVLIGAWASK